MTARAKAGQTRRGASAEVQAARARVVELAAQGWAPERIAKEMGRSARWVKRARDEMKREIEAAAAARIEGAVKGAEEAKRILAEETAAAARRVRELGRSYALLDGEVEIKAAALGLKANLAILDRGGVPAKSEQDMTIGLSAEKRAAIEKAIGGIE